ncbi:MAG: hypothetical protein K8R59_05350 [Thermoanaerobaculales bacterium]|nr:hypothetical protein [Thermoanaerobaculales bacterium]
MTFRAWLTCFVVVGIGFGAVLNGYGKEPVFVRWLVADDPGDETIRAYWERYDREELSANEMVDLGTMLFYRGYPKDAVRLFEAALDEDKKLEEAWFRIGLVEHQQGNHRQARMAYKKCLHLFKGHGWCNFYLALLEEQDGNAKTAMEYYRRAFRYAPALADPDTNPELASSELSVGAWLQMARDRAFKKALPMPYLDSQQVKKVRASYDNEKTVPGNDEKPARKKMVLSKEAATVAPKSVVAPMSGGGSAAVVSAKGDEAAEEKVVKKKTSANRRRSSKPKQRQPAPKSGPASDDQPLGHPDQPFGLPSTSSVSSEGGF